MKKNLKIIIISLISLISLGGISFVFYNIFKPQTINNISITKQYTVTIEGAVKNPGEYKFNKPKTIREIIFNAHVLTNADIDSLNMEKTISEDTEIIIPYKVGSDRKSVV